MMCPNIPYVMTDVPAATADTFATGLAGTFRRPSVGPSSPLFHPGSNRHTCRRRGPKLFTWFHVPHRRR